MSETKTDRAMVDEAKRIIDGIVSHQKSTDDRLSGFEKQVDDMKKAQRLMTEATQTVAVPSFGGEARLRSFVKEDGSLQWTSQTKAIKVAGRGTINTEVSGLLDSVPANDWHADLQKIASRRAFCRMIMSSPHTPKTDLELFKHLEKAPKSIAPAVQRSFYDAAGQGAEWIPDQFVPQLTEEFTIPRGLRSLFQEVEVDRNTILIPRLVRGGRPYIKGQVSTDSPVSYQGSSVQTAQNSISIKGMATRYVIDDAAAEDSAIALLPTLGRQIVSDLSSAFEDTMINGDTAAVHQDDLANWNLRNRWGTVPALGTASDHRRAFDGFRRQSFARGTNAAEATGTLTLDILIAELGKMGELAVQRQLLICSPEFMVKQLMGLGELQTIDKFGAQAVVLTGQVASVLGVPVVMSRFMGADMNLTGVYDNVTTDKTGFLLVNRDSYTIYNRRGILVETDRDISAGAIEMVSTSRAVMDSPDSATAKNVVYNYRYSI